MGTNDKKICVIWLFTEKSDFQGWFTKKIIYRGEGDFLKKEGLDSLQI